MSDYDMHILVAIIFASVLFSGFMSLYVQEPTIDYTSLEGEGKNWSEPQNATDVTGATHMIDVFGETGIWLVGLFISAMTIIGVLIVVRFLWW